MITSIINPYDYQEYYNNNDLINEPFIISLDKDIEKYQNSKQILEKLNFQPMKFHAVNGKELKTSRPDIFKKFKSLSDGEIGCFISHFLIYYLASQHSNPEQYTLIFEDDIGTNVDTNSLNNKLKNAITYNKSLIYLGKCGEFCFMTTQLHDDLYQGYKPYCMHAYMIKNSFAQKVVDAINNLNIIDRPIDHIIFNYVDKDEVLEFHPSLFYQDPKYQSNLRGTLLQIANEVECSDLPNLPNKLIKVHQPKNRTAIIIIVFILITFFVIYFL